MTVSNEPRREPTGRTCGYAVLCFFAVPVVLTVVDRFVIEIAIGQLIPVFVVGVFFVALPLFGWTLAKSLKKPLAIILGLVTAYLSAAVVFIWFLFLANLFGNRGIEPL